VLFDAGNLYLLVIGFGFQSGCLRIYACFALIVDMDCKKDYAKQQNAEWNMSSAVGSINIAFVAF
jgi:hypothetical protein